MPEHQPRTSRRTFLRTNATLLAGFALSAALPEAAHAAGSAAPAGASAAAQAAAGGTDLARYRPVAVSSTDWAPTPGSFAVDGLAQSGVRGSGWRAAAGDPQWISVDLQAPATIESVVLVFEADSSDPGFTPDPGINPFLHTTGFEALSSCAVAFSLEVSDDGDAWRSVYETSSGTGGTMTITLPEPVTARWIRMTSTKRANANPVGLNGFEVYGSCRTHRPAATGWTDWGRHTAQAPALKVAGDGTVPLESGWTLTMDDLAGSDDGAALSAGGLDVSGWLPATVPGTVHASLVEQGHLPEPTVGFNNMRAPEALSRHGWWYRRAFHLPAGLATGHGRRVWLEFDGVNHQAEVWLNGGKVGEVTYPVARAAFDVTGALGSGEQVLAVSIAPMPHPGNPGDKGPSGISTLNSVAAAADSPTYLSISGWDWMPAVRDRAAGIWNHVRLRSTGDVVIGDPRVDTALPDLPAAGAAEVTVVVPVRNAGGAAQRTTVGATLHGARVSSTVTLAAGESREIVFAPADHPQLRIATPQLWWPNGYGDPALHDLVLTATAAGKTSDRRTAQVGLRQFDYHYDQPIVIGSNGHSAPQTVNLPQQQARYVRIQCGKRATGFGASMWTLSVLDSAAPGTDLALHRTATASSSDNDSDQPANAVDGSDTTRWSSGYSDDQWIQVDLGASAAFDQVVITWETAYALTFTVQVSDDGATWTDVQSVSNTGTQLQIAVNGVRVLCRGGNWGFDELLRRMLPDRMDDAVGMHRDMNFTMIRNWIGSSNREEFFAACDRNGILVWNDFWEGDAIFPPDAGLTAFLDIARDTVLRYRHHPCLAVWCATNESDPPAAIDAGLRAAVTAVHPGILYQGNSAGGIVTGHGPYSWIDPAKYFSGDTYSIGSYGFHSEIGIPTVPVAESMRHLAGDQPSWPIGDVWFHHDWCTRGGQNPDTYRAAVDDRFGASDSLDDFCARAQFVNYESMRAIFEAYNATMWDDASGVLLWMSHPAHHSTVWQTYDYDLDVNGSYYGARKGCEPLHVQASLADWQVHAVNQTAAALTGVTVTARLVDLHGTSLAAAQTRTLDVAASSSAAAFTVPFADGLPTPHLLRLTLTDRHGTQLSDNSYLRYRAASDVRAVNDLATARLRTGVRRTGRDEAVVSLRNDGDGVAALLRLGVRDAHADTRVLPARYSDNYLWLLPGESRDVTVSWPARALPSGEPRFTAEALNLPLRRL
ncbi:F5/8 type C domain-containing protein [Actinacidiphila yanglinensis]|uniref:F5/8 type C domain-containing protein n=1 Tax=Actinacidiphila yanglinensis TaxID=310779 RepID=A0A1H6E1X5_9ACTN|nr:discoidin domain-containing protein [Actinacidiphila yanglinensis]SEG91582.1 F5/8 type C domain-containing protein [Actinacidiphila yanglinensis]